MFADDENQGLNSCAHQRTLLLGDGSVSIAYVSGIKACFQTCHCEKRRRGATKLSSWIATTRSAPRDDKPGLETRPGSHQCSSAASTELSRLNPKRFFDFMNHRVSLISILLVHWLGGLAVAAD